MKILLLSFEYPPIGGGGAKVIYELAHAFAKKGHEIDVVTMSFRGLPRKQLQEGVTVYRMPCLRCRKNVCSPVEMIPYMASALVFLLWRLRRKQYDVLHTHFILPDGVLSYLIKRLYGLPFLVTAHGSDVPGYNPNRFKCIHSLLRPFWETVSSSADKIICPSRKIAQLILDHNPEVRTEIIANPIDISRFHFGDQKRDRILVVSRMFERKGVQYVLRALEGTDLGYEVNIVGDGPYLGELFKQRSASGVNVNLLGYLDNTSPELRELYETSRIFIFLSESENFPIVLLEAMCSGCAVITTSGTGCAEVVGDTGALVPVRDAAAARRELERLCANRALCSEMGRRGRERAVSLFETSVVVSKHLDLYRSYRQA